MIVKNLNSKDFEVSDHIIRATQEKTKLPIETSCFTCLRTAKLSNQSANPSSPIRAFVLRTGISQGINTISANSKGTSQTARRAV